MPKVKGWVLKEDYKEMFKYDSTFKDLNFNIFIGKYPETVISCLEVPDNLRDKVYEAVCDEIEISWKKTGKKKKYKWSKEGELICPKKK